MAEKPDIIVPEGKKTVELMCHRIYAPVVVPEQDPLNPKMAKITPRFGNFGCVKDKCTLWNKEALECYDVSQAKSMALIAEYAFAKLNDVHIEGGGS